MERSSWARLRRAPWLSTKLWTQRLAYWGGGFAVGLTAVFMAIYAEHAQALFARLLQISPWLSLIVTPLGFAASVWITRRWFPGAQGSGIPQAIVARELTDDASRGRLLSLRIAVGKVGLTLLGLACGASIGREGPTVQIGASIMHLVGKIWGRQQNALIAAGAAAGVAAAFNTPLGGIVFAIEEMGRSLEKGVNGLMLGTVIIAGIASLTLMGDYNYFGHMPVVLTSVRDWLAIPVTGAVCGLAGGLFSMLVVAISSGRLFNTASVITRQPIRFAAACGLLVAVLGILTNQATFGTGYEAASGIITGDEEVIFAYGILKFFATALSAVSGMPGGFFAPSLSVGAGLGADLAPLFPNVPISAIALMAMVAYFAGVVQAPITAFVIVAEMTDSYGLTVPLMASSWIGYGSAKLIGARPVYHALALPLRQRFRDERPPDAVTVPAQEPAAEAAAAAAAADAEMFRPSAELAQPLPVVGEPGGDPEAAIPPAASAAGAASMPADDAPPEEQQPPAIRS
jgi:H+/Cl- antiporter ClcA